MRAPPPGADRQQQRTTAVAGRRRAGSRSRRAPGSATCARRRLVLRSPMSAIGVFAGSPSWRAGRCELPSPTRQHRRSEIGGRRASFAGLQQHAAGRRSYFTRGLRYVGDRVALLIEARVDPARSCKPLSERYRAFRGDRCRRDAVAGAASPRGGGRRTAPRSRIASGKSQKALKRYHRRSASKPTVGRPPETVGRRCDPPASCRNRILEKKC